MNFTYEQKLVALAVHLGRRPNEACHFVSLALGVTNNDALSESLQELERTHRLFKGHVYQQANDTVWLVLGESFYVVADKEQAEQAFGARALADRFNRG